MDWFPYDGTSIMTELKIHKTIRLEQQLFLAVLDG